MSTSQCQPDSCDHTAWVLCPPASPSDRSTAPSSLAHGSTRMTGGCQSRALLGGQIQPPAVTMCLKIPTAHFATLLSAPTQEWLARRIYWRPIATCSTTPGDHLCHLEVRRSFLPCHMHAVHDAVQLIPADLHMPRDGPTLVARRHAAGAQLRLHQSRGEACRSASAPSWRLTTFLASSAGRLHFTQQL